MCSVSCLGISNYCCGVHAMAVMPHVARDNFQSDLCPFSTLCFCIISYTVYIAHYALITIENVIEVEVLGFREIYLGPLLKFTIPAPV
jgi:hypothetical protein